MSKWIKENNLKYKLKKEFMERKYDYHNYQYVLKWEPKDAEEVSVNKEEKMDTEDGD